VRRADLPFGFHVCIWPPINCKCNSLDSFTAVQLFYKLILLFVWFKCQPNHEPGNCITSVNRTITSQVQCNVKSPTHCASCLNIIQITSISCRLDDVVNRTSTWNRVDPVIRNTVTVPGNGYVVVRFISNNPGVWFMHCHQESHSIGGMMMVWNEAPEHHPPLPPGFGVCDDFEWTAEQFQDYLQPKLRRG